MSDPIEPDPVAVTAGEEDHSDPWEFAGEDADPPENPSEDEHARPRGLGAPSDQPEEALRGAGSWRNCNSSLTLVAAINARWPNRDKTSDGTIGDAAHATRLSDHNPWVKDSSGIGVVRARDVDKDGIDAAWIVEELRKLGVAGDRRLHNEGYVIFNRRITKPDFSGWAVYTGINPHDKHFHVSFSLDQPGYDDSRPWAFLAGGGTPTPVPPPAGQIPAAPGLPAWPHQMAPGHYFGLKTGPVVSHGGAYAWERPFVKLIQQRLIAKGYVPGVKDWRSGWADGIFEQPTADAVTRFQRREMPGTRFFGQVWADDWARLAR